MDSTKLKLTAGTAALLFFVAFLAFASNPSRIQIGTVTGAVVGGLAGSAMTGNVFVTVAGAAAGGVIGYEIGRRMK